MPNNRDVPYAAFNFKVSYGGNINGAFSEVSGLGAEITIAEYRVGTQNGNYMRKIPNINKTGDVTLKRGVIHYQDWKKWIDDVRNKGVAAQKDIVDIILFDDTNKNEVEKWRLRGVVPIKYTGPALSAKGGTDVAIEELVLSSEKIEFAGKKNPFDD